ncbi:MAG: phosphotransferase family protein [Desulfovibrionaceae bacterium]
MIQVQNEKLDAYIKGLYGPDARLVSTGKIGAVEQQGMKELGYGKPMLVRFEAGGEIREGVFSTMRGDKYGHQFYWDRAHVLLCQYETAKRMERHVKALGLGYVDAEDAFQPLKDPKEFFILNEFVVGRDYFVDLERIRAGELKDFDVALAREFGLWMAELHAEKCDDENLYYRRIRETFGDSECILGLIDEAYPRRYEAFSEERFMALEKRLIDWRWRLKNYAHRLSAVHGDFHPWNVLVCEDCEGPEFKVLDRSRGEWGEPADDLSTMAINYILFGLYDRPRLEGSFLRLYETLFETYLEASNDTEILQVMAPFFVFRALVIASPEWYPSHPEPVRRGLFRFMENVLEDDVFDWRNVNRYME